MGTGPEHWARLWECLIVKLSVWADRAGVECGLVNRISARNNGQWLWWVVAGGCLHPHCHQADTGTGFMIISHQQRDNRQQHSNMSDLSHRLSGIKIKPRGFACSSPISKDTALGCRSLYFLRMRAEYFQKFYFNVYLVQFLESNRLVDIFMYCVLSKI